MIDLDERLSGLESKHRAALHWFRERTGQVIPRPRSLPDGTLLASKAKGIYKLSSGRVECREEEDTPIGTARKRLARGEITREQFEGLRDLLGS